MPRKSRVPQYLLHKSSGQARVFLPRPGGGYDETYLGVHGSPDSKAEYARFIAELTGVAVPSPADKPPSAERSVNEVLLAYWQFAQGYYVGADGKPTSELTEMRHALKPVRALFGETPAADFGPVKLAAVRDQMVKAGWCRSLVNARTDRVRRCFKWAASQELVPGGQYEALRTLAGLRKGRTAARETEPILPVDPGVVQATLPHMTPTLRAMVEAQRWAGMRPQDVCYLRPADIDRSGPVWVYAPKVHKTAHRGKRRVIHLGPKVQAILAPFLAACADPTAYVFSAAKSVEEFRATRSASRKTPKYPSHLARNEGKRKAAPGRAPGTHYTNSSYRHAVLKAVDRAIAWRAKLAAGAEFDRVPGWAPNQLRHLRGTEVRKAFGLEAAQVLLGHARADVTQVYAERDFALAARVAAETG